MGDLIQFVPRPRTSLPSERSQRMIAEARAQYQAIFPDDLRAIGERIIRSPEFQDEIAKSDKDDADFPFDPVCVAIMRGHGPVEDTAPFETNPENLA